MEPHGERRRAKGRDEPESNPGAPSVGPLCRPADEISPLAENAERVLSVRARAGIY